MQSKTNLPDAPRLDGGLRTLVGYNLKRASNAIQSQAARVLAQHDLRITTYSALCIICDQPDVTPAQLAACLNMERSNTVLIIDALEQADLITRNRAPHDGRSFVLRATLAGRQQRDSAAIALARHETVALAGVSASDIVHLCKLLKRIEANCHD
jgi:DNA-binding MarR family transcriptional regulator